MNKMIKEENVSIKMENNNINSVIGTKFYLKGTSIIASLTFIHLVNSKAKPPFSWDKISRLLL